MNSSNVPKGINFQNKMWNFLLSNIWSCTYTFWSKFKILFILIYWHFNYKYLKWKHKCARHEYIIQIKILFKDFFLEINNINKLLKKWLVKFDEHINKPRVRIPPAEFPFNSMSSCVYFSTHALAGIGNNTKLVKTLYFLPQFKNWLTIKSILSTFPTLWIIYRENIASKR